jgi:hypothetical protein
VKEKLYLMISKNELTFDRVLWLYRFMSKI